MRTCLNLFFVFVKSEGSLRNGEREKQRQHFCFSACACLMRKNSGLPLIGVCLKLCEIVRDCCWLFLRVFTRCF